MVSRQQAMRLITILRKELEKRIGKIKANRDALKHFGMELSQDGQKEDVTFAQTFYIKELKPIDCSFDLS